MIAVFKKKQSLPAWIGYIPFETALPVRDIARPRDPRPRQDRDQRLSRP